MSAVIINPPLTPSVFEPPAPKPIRPKQRCSSLHGLARRANAPALEMQPLPAGREQLLMDRVQAMTEAELNLRLMDRHIMDKRIFVLAELIEEEAYARA